VKERQEARTTSPALPWAGGYVAVPFSEIETVRLGAGFRAKVVSLDSTLEHLVLMR